jgi:hypothetical protein
MSDEPSGKQVSFVQVLLSVLSAFFGVQSGKNRERDFQHGKPWHYIFVGLLMTGVFLLLVWGLVSIVMKMAV